MKYSYDVCNVGWSKEFEEKVIKNYKYVKQVYIDIETEDEKEKKLLRKVKEIVNNKNYKDSDKLKNDLEQNKIFEFNTDVDFVIRRLIFNIEDEKVVCIKNCVIQFLLKKENEILNFLNNFTNKAEIGKINVKFEEYKWHDEIRDNCVETIKELLDLDVKESVLEDFFKDRTVVYSKEIKLNQINDLRKAIKVGNPQLQGFILLFIAPEDIDLGTVTQAVKDANFFLGARENTDLLHEIKIEKDCKETKIKAIVVV